MKVLDVLDANLKDCLKAAQRQRVVLTRKGKPVALLLGIKGMHIDTIASGESAEFWALLRERRAQKKITRYELEKRLAKAEHDKEKD